MNGIVFKTCRDVYVRFSTKVLVCGVEMCVLLNSCMGRTGGAGVDREEVGSIETTNRWTGHEKQVFEGVVMQTGVCVLSGVT